MNELLFGVAAVVLSSGLATAATGLTVVFLSKAKHYRAQARHECAAARYQDRLADVQVCNNNIGRLQEKMQANTLRLQTLQIDADIARLPKVQPVQN